MIPRIILVLLLLLISRNAEAQEDKQVHDSTIMVRDSILYNAVDSASSRNLNDSLKYEKLEQITEGSKFWRSVHRFLFRRLQREKRPALPYTQVIDSRNHKTGQGKYIRNIIISTTDPFGFSIRDTTVGPDKAILGIGNALHNQTGNTVIRNLLLFRQYERYDSVLVKESERLIRSQQYIRDVNVDVNRITRDSVDVYVRAADVWSLLPSAKATGSETGIGLKDLNFLGTGTTFELNTLWKHGRGNISSLSYLMPNIRNTYVSLNVQLLFSPGGNLDDLYEFDRYYYSPVSYDPKYLFSDNRNIVRSIEASRPFFSPTTRYAGGIFLGQIMTTQTIIDADSLGYLSNRSNIKDFWAGRSWRLFSENGRERITSLVLSGRFVTIRSPERSSEALEAGIFNNHAYQFAGLSITSRKYFRDRYIFNYGKIEDVPSGKIAGITLGSEYQRRNRFYIGLNAGTGTYYSFGYLSTHLSYGTFADRTGFHQGMLTGRITYFTRLLTIGNWKLRQFIRPSFAFGINRSPADNQPLKVGIQGFESIESLASNITVISLQTQTYAPWNLGGFHFGPFIFAHAGILGEEPMGHKGKLYSLLGLGVLIKNDYLMFNTFQVSLSFYPYIPESRYNVFRTNAYKTSDYGFRDFEVSKPGIVE